MAPRLRVPSIQHDLLRWSFVYEGLGAGLKRRCRRGSDNSGHVDGAVGFEQF
jgi:hypothetical protein